VTRRIAIVDDNPVIRRLLREILESADSSWAVCAEAADGREGVRKIQETNPDIAVLDLTMPLMNGLEAARILSKTSPQVPLILCTLHEDPTLKTQASGVGIKAIVSKAENMQILVATIRTLLGSTP
jgi:DNA-binding NarL/FixJ family response regulator